MELEKIYTEKTSLTHRKEFAQFFTPQPIANIMSDWLLGNKSLKTVLEPAFGLGIFSRTLLSKLDNLKIKGFDIDETIFSKAKAYFKSQKNVSLKLEDYMFNDWKNKYDGIICNPPYLKFHDYDNKQILQEVENNLKFKFNGFTNLYTLFLLKSIFQLKKDGRAAYIIPSEFLNSDYGKLVKEYLLKTKTLRHLFIIDFKENVFDNAMTTASILLLANDKNNSEINISTIDSKSDLQLIDTYIKSYPKGRGEFTFKLNDLDPNIKWRKYYQLQNSINYKNLVPFSTYAKVVRGIATGANDYFTFKKSKAKEFSIPKGNLKPCICKAKDVKGNFFTESDYKNLVKNNELVYLFDGKNSTNKNVLAYIEKGVKDKINEKYLTKCRKPWYSLENRPPAPIWVSVFNRDGVKFIRNEANISNLTTFHCVYPTNSNLFSKVTDDFLFAYLLTDVAKEIFSDNRREYGNGLKKFEPNDLNKSKILDLSTLSESQVDRILALYTEYKKSKDEKFISKIDEILRTEFANAKSHTHLQFAPANTTPKIAKEYAFANATN
ncbi:SAM-dependent DNA methyltransferase [Polaribacter batillariae]|uniref:site-specific DNA-methyltransferase (adenine-specific) n=1 Tax=Polaribacter batillariae TaxID=2808900 RepID=A0ABX7SXR8_9FLAO|nr:N-6 DNA methylase [Polaribacter batillariae]QTD37619.1 SAM-dependent DNA methyltransferase [Polaribacter batillariae]